jgi:hypothetical protein
MSALRQVLLHPWLVWTVRHLCRVHLSNPEGLNGWTSGGCVETSRAKMPKPLLEQKLPIGTMRPVA